MHITLRIPLIIYTSPSIPRLHNLLREQVYLKVHPDDAILLHETRDSVPMEHCSTLFQGVTSVSNNVGLRELGEHRQLPSRRRRGRCERNAPRSNFASSGLTLASLLNLVEIKKTSETFTSKFLSSL